MKDAKTFAAIGLDLVKTLNGEDHSNVQTWKERVADPIKFYLKENNVVVNIYLGHSKSLPSTKFTQT